MREVPDPPEWLVRFAFWPTPSPVANGLIDGLLLMLVVAVVWVVWP